MVCQYLKRAARKLFEEAESFRQNLEIDVQFEKTVHQLHSRWTVAPCPGFPNSIMVDLSFRSGTVAVDSGPFVRIVLT